jgi:hypothetical protein
MCLCVANYSRQELLGSILQSVEMGSIILSVVHWFGRRGPKIKLIARKA